MTDPAHPLFGGRFPVVRLFRPPHAAGVVEVLYRQQFRLRVPLAATDRATTSAPHPRTKLTPEIARELIALVAECPSCRTHPSPSGPDSPTT